MATKRPIDLQRDSAGSMTIGSPEEGKIDDFVQFKDRLLIVKEKAVYEVILADMVDPDRTNPGIPNAQQRVLNIGAESPILGRTLLTAKSLFRGAYLKDIDCDLALVRSLAAAKDAAAMQTALDLLIQKQRDIEGVVAGAKLSGGFAVPTIDNLEADVRSFIQRADHFAASTMDIARQFYGKKAKHADALHDLITAEYGAEDSFAKFVGEAADVLRYARDVRNAVEHPKEHEHLKIRNFRLLADGTLTPPSLELVHPKRSHAPVHVDVFMNRVVDELTGVFESLLAYLCDRRSAVADSPVFVGQFSPERLGQKHVRYSYAMRIGDEVVPMS